MVSDHRHGSKGVNGPQTGQETDGPRRVGIITTSRADYGIYQPVLRALAGSGDLKPLLWVAGMHMSPEFDLTVRRIEKDGWAIADRIECLVSADSEEAIASSMGLTTLRFATSLARQRPDIALVLGDRFEMHAAACAAVPLRIPLAHIHGGEETENAIDNVFRHSLTKLSHLHFAATELARRRVMAMGEDPERVIVSGAPALDSVAAVDLLDIAQLSDRFGLPSTPFVLATFHPETLNPKANIAALEMVWEAARATGLPVVFTKANADAAGRAVNDWLEERCAADPERSSLVGTMGVQGYFSAMKAARLMIGNSSSGIIEAASFGLPVVNIGERQKGRERSANTIDTPAQPPAIRAAVERALSDDFRNSARACNNVYGRGQASERIVSGLRSFLDDGAPIAKAFHMEE